MAWTKGKPRPASTRARMSAASKKAWADPEVRARMSAASKKALAEKKKYSWQPPAEFRELYDILAKKVGKSEARRLVLIDVKRAETRKARAA